MNASAAVLEPTPVYVPPFTTRVARAFAAGRELMKDPGRLDQVLAFLLAVNIKVIAKRVRDLESTPEGRQILATQPRIDRTHVDFDALEQLPDGTLGREYVRFLKANGITPDVFAELPDVGDPRAAYMILRMRQTHDLWHVLTGYQPDVPGEILLQAFTHAQTGAPGSALIALFGTLRYTMWKKGAITSYRALMNAHRHGKECAFLPTVHWEREWSTPVSELRERLSCPAV